MPDEKVCICYKNVSGNLNMFLLNKDGEVIREKKNVAEGNVLYFDTVTINQMIYLCCKAEVKFETKVSIFVYDTTLKSINNINVKDTQFSMTSFEDLIFLGTSQEDDFILLTKYNNKLERMDHETEFLDVVDKIKNTFKLEESHNQIEKFTDDIYHSLLPW